MHTPAAIKTLLNFPKFLSKLIFFPHKRGEWNKFSYSFRVSSLISVFDLFCPASAAPLTCSFLIQAFNLLHLFPPFMTLELLFFSFLVLLLKSQQLINKKLLLTHRFAETMRAACKASFFYSTIMTVYLQTTAWVRRNKGPLMLLKTRLSSFVPIFARRLFLPSHIMNKTPQCLDLEVNSYCSPAPFS